MAIIEWITVREKADTRRCLGRRRSRAPRSASRDRAGPSPISGTRPWPTDVGIGLLRVWRAACQRSERAETQEQTGRRRESHSPLLRPQRPRIALTARTLRPNDELLRKVMRAALRHPPPRQGNQLRSICCTRRIEICARKASAKRASDRTLSEPAFALKIRCRVAVLVPMRRAISATAMPLRFDARCLAAPQLPSVFACTRVLPESRCHHCGRAAWRRRQLFGGLSSNTT